LAPGFDPRPAWDLTDFGGKTISDLVFVNCYVGSAGSWAAGDMTNIDKAMSGAMSDSGLESVIGQYFPGSISARMLPSVTQVVDTNPTVYKNDVETLATQLEAAGARGEADPESTVIDILLPSGVVLSDDFAPGYVPPAGAAAADERRSAGRIVIGPDEAADSRHGLGGYHGSVKAPDGTAVYYAVGVYSEGTNGIVAFDQPWKNVVATFYHELNEARTDPDVEDVNRSGNNNLLGWYSQAGGGEIGDLPINEATDIAQVFQEIPLADGSGTVPIQLMWSNRDDGPAASTG
jgi:hypothetical protein